MSKVITLTAVLVLVLTLMVGCSVKEEITPTPTTPALEGTITILHAGSLAVPFKEMEAEFEAMHPNVDVQCESASSGVTIRKVTQLGKKAEIVASADYSLIPDLMFPEFAGWYVTFARNQMVVAYTDNSKFAGEVNQDNWYDILTREGVEYGHSDLLDPCGYRTLLVWHLAEEYYKEPGLYERLQQNCPEKNIRPKSVQLVALLESGDLDYASEYRSVAQQHGLKFTELPTEIDLSDIKFKDFYAQSEVDIPGKEPGTTITEKGKPIVYGVTIPTNAPDPDLATAFMKYLLGEKGQAIMNNNGQPSIVPAVPSDPDKIPSELKEYIAGG
jgi:molybdate/tungstate transport system substrate-binding protein